MKWITWWKKDVSGEELQSLELKLDMALVPVTPQPEFITGLRESLLKQGPKIELVLEPQHQKLQTGLLVTGGVLGAMAMILTGVRGVVSIVGVIGLLISMIKQNSQGVSSVPSN